MCGIFGITENNERLVKNMISRCSHRGPDGNSIWLNEYLTLGHNLLAITSKPEDGVQPYATNNGNVLTYNGEIFNYNQLINKFKHKFIPKSTCDTELLGWLLDNFRYEEVICNLIDSMHAFVFFNKNKNEIVLSRDHAGIKPLYFAEVKNGIVFSSEIKGLIDILPNSRKIDRLGLACTCLLGVNVLRQTLFNGIFKILPGETMVYDLENKKIKSTFRNLIKPNSNKEFNIEEFYNESILTVNNSTLGLRNFGVFLSGGLDSSVIAYNLRLKLKALNSFTTIMEPNIEDGEEYNSDAEIAKNLQMKLILNIMK